MKMFIEKYKGEKHKKKKKNKAEDRIDRELPRPAFPSRKLSWQFLVLLSVSVKSG